MTRITETVAGAVVVGIDGSEPSKEALRWSAHQAEVTGAPLVAVTTWHYPMTFGYPVPWPSNTDFAADAKRILDDTIEEVIGSERATSFIREVVHGQPALTLEECSQTASLVVVGSRGHGEFAGMLLGSVSTFLSTHSHCPIVIIRGGETVDERID